MGIQIRKHLKGRDMKVTLESTTQMTTLNGIPARMRQLRALIERRTGIVHWGKQNFVVPRLVSRVFGDGRKLIALFPIMFRPNHFVVRIDSAWSLSNHANEDEHPPSEWLDQLYEEIEAEFLFWPWARAYGLLESRDLGEERSARTDFSAGSSWSELGWPKVGVAGLAAISGGHNAS